MPNPQSRRRFLRQPRCHHRLLPRPHRQRPSAPASSVQTVRKMAMPRAPKARAIRSTARTLSASAKDSVVRGTRHMRAIMVAAKAEVQKAFAARRWKARTGVSIRREAPSRKARPAP